MDQKSIVLYLARKGSESIAIHSDLVVTLDAERTIYPCVACYLREARLARSNPGTTLYKLNIEPNDYDEAIFLALNEEPFASIRQLAQFTHLPRTTIHRLLRGSLEFRVRHLRWVPHRRSDIQKSNRFEVSRKLWSLLTTQQERYWHDVVTLDESWFCRNTDHERSWLLKKNGIQFTQNNWCRQ
jgi:hypothetical protein